MPFSFCFDKILNKMRIKWSDKIMTIKAKYLRKPYATGFRFKINNKGGKRELELVLLKTKNACVTVPFVSWVDVLPKLERIQANL